ncbi:MAG: thioredoxin domain-containing protein [Alphaproteobacteria bacterium]
MDHGRRVPGNKLGDEASPYLLQHQYNPVHWLPWGEPAFARARTENKPILLSIGYAACHWCHVMAHESFEHPAIAAAMNDSFINIKVDREERPDVDAIYQHALALLGEQGGWPLTMFLTPDLRPFWGGTYFPPEDRYGRPGFAKVLARIGEIYRNEHDKIEANAAALREALAGMGASRKGGLISRQMIDSIAEHFLRMVDTVNGGLGGAPKFPQPPVFELLWRAWKRTGVAQYRDAVLVTLDRMSQGGIYDHLGGGFARYSTDAVWLAPHFEKMLYDNAQLIDLLTLVWRETQNPLYQARVRETIDWLLREMVQPGGGFAGTLDADSEGEEGKFYVWSAAEIDALLGDDAALFKEHYDVSARGNWEHKTILNRTKKPFFAGTETEARLAAAREKLLAARAKRIRPALDDKVLTDWNGLIIAALAQAAEAFGRPDWLAAARRAFDFVHIHMTHNGRLRHSWRQGKLQHPATLEDYAGMIRAALILYETTGDHAYLDRAQAWLATADAHYRDAAEGGYFTSADDVTDVIVRSKGVHDNATPSGNGLMAQNLARLHYLTGDDGYRKAAERVIASFTGNIEREGVAMPVLINANDLLTGAVQLVVCGARAEPGVEALLAAARAVSQPNLLTQVIADGLALPKSHPAHGKDRIDGRATAYVCRGQTCSLPVTDGAALPRLLQ